MNVKGACEVRRAAHAIRGVRKTHGKARWTSFPAGTPPGNRILDASLAIFLIQLDEAHVRPGNVRP
jgi:hypothetical protein